MMCIATVMLWAGSYAAPGRIAFAFDRSHLVEVVAGKLAFVTFSHDYFSIHGRYELDWIYLNADHCWSLLGIRHYDVGFVTITDASLALFIIATSLLPLLRFLQPLVEGRRRRRRIRIGACPTCGYNLTGNVSGTCPECGILNERIDGVRSVAVQRGVLRGCCDRADVGRG